MRRVAVFGNAGGGKSTLARRLAAATELPLHVIDEMQFHAGGKAVPEDEYLRNHAELLRRDEWIIDGFGGIRAAWERFSAADTLVLVDLPLINHYWWVTKRLILGLFVTPKGWPRDSPVWSSSLNSYRVIWSCHTRLTPKYRALIAESASSKRVHHLRSRAEVDAFIERVGRERSRSMGQG
jgi:adenylate kinase family enzyme